MRDAGPHYAVDLRAFPPICLPTPTFERNRHRLVDITELGDSWRRFLDPGTGELHDGAVYAARCGLHYPE